MNNRNIKPPAWLLIAVLMMLALRFFTPVAIIVPAGWNLFGLLPILLGLGINLAADRAFHRAKTPVDPSRETTVLVKEGVFQASRNPMYLGFVLILAGMASLLQAASPCLVVAAFWFLLDRVYISVEEHRLGEKFGDSYLEYTHRVRRWL